MAEPLPYREREILRRYAKTLEGRQSELADLFGVCRETVNRWLQGKPCDQYEVCMDLVRRVLVSRPEWGVADMDRTVSFVRSRLKCDPEKARVIASVLVS
jgi:DNA-binding XRE family transcriptional regulator